MSELWKLRLVYALLALLAGIPLGWVLISVPPSVPYYARPSQYELLNGPPDRVCKWWGQQDHWREKAEMTECIEHD